MHRGRSTTVPVLVRRTWFEGETLRRATEQAEFEVGLSRVDGEPETWLYAGDGPRRSLELSPESAERLARQILGRLAAGGPGDAGG